MAEQHPIEGLMTTAMESIKEMVDVNTIVGDAVQSPDGTVIIPISRVAFGFAAGGGEYSQACSSSEDESGGDESGGSYGKFPFAGGSGAGVSIHPVAFMVVGNGQIRLLPVNINSSMDKMFDVIPDIISRIEDMMKKKVGVKKESKSGFESGGRSGFESNGKPGSEHAGRYSESYGKSSKEAEID